MNIKQLRLFNFWSHKDTTINFDEPFYMILGKIQGSEKSNGSGKSTIARGIAYALYGDASDEIKNDDAIYNDAEKMGVMLTFELNGIDYTIKRKLVRGASPQIFIQKGDTKEFKYGVKQGQHMINTILGADFSIFKNTSYFKQGDISSFSTLTPKEAKEVVMKILQLDNYNEYERVAKEKAVEVSGKILKIETEITNLETRIIEESNKIDTTVTEDDLTLLQNTLKELQDKKLQADKIAEQKEEAIKEIQKKLTTVVTLQNKAEFEIGAIDKRVKKLEGLSCTCPTCETILDKEHIGKIVNVLRTEVKPFQEQLEILNTELSKLVVEESQAKGYTLNHPSYDKAILDTRLQLGNVESELKRAKQDQEKIKNLNNQNLEKRKLLDNWKEFQTIYTNLQKAFGKNGIQAYIIENVIPEIQATTNDILAGLDTTIRINIDSQKELKKGGFSETLNINIITPFGERPYTNYSGGEKTFIDFALRIALSVILTRRSKCKIQTLILDEVFVELDTVNKRIISKALRFIANRFDFKKILIISHAEELQDSFDNVIKVVFDGETSTIAQREKVKV